MYKQLGNLPIRTKIPVGLSILVGVIVLLGVFSMQRLSNLNDTAATIRETTLPSSSISGRMMGHLEAVRVNETELILATSDFNGASDRLKRAIEAVTADRAQYQPLLDEAAKQPEAAEQTRALKDFDAHWKDYQLAIAELSGLISKADDKGTIALFNGGSHDAYEAGLAAVTRAVDWNINRGRQLSAESSELFRTTCYEVTGMLVLCCALGGSLGLFFVRTVSSPIRGLADAMTRLAARDLSTRIDGGDRKDEIGAMAKAVEIFKTSMIEADRLNAEQEAQRKIKEERAAQLEGLTKSFGDQVGSLVQALSQSASDLQSTAGSMSATADQTNAQSIAVANAADQASSNVQTVAVATEELTSSIREISRQVLESARIAGVAVEDARQTDTTVQELAEGAQRIGEVVTLIKDIASQTNLLALNATIEAARAGEAGKGFSVVASEVKSLAAQTARATDEIAGQIEGIQRSTTEAVEAIRGIGRTIAEISQIATAIASAVEEQGAATQEISRNVQEAARGTEVVTSHISGVKQAASDTGTAAGHVLSSASELARRADQLNDEVTHFVREVKAA